MGKSERNAAKSMADQTYKKAQTQTDENDKQFKGMLGDAQTRTTDAYNTASDAYKGMGGPTGAYDPEAYKKISSQNDKNIASGGYDPAALNDLRTQQKSNIQTAGYNPEDVAKINKNYDALTANGLGGVNADSAATIRGGYTNFAKTGGLDDATADAMRRRTASGIASTYSTLGSNMVRKQAAQGFGGGGGETAQLARQLGNTQGEALTNTDAEIGKMRQEGMLKGMGGLSEFETGVASGQRQAVAGQGQFAGDQAGHRITATGQSADTEANVAGNRIKASQAEQDLATGAADQRIRAAGGMANLYQASPGYVTDMVKSILQSQQQGGQLSTQQTQIMEELSKQPGLFQTIMNNVMQMGGMAAGIMTGIGAVGGAGKSALSTGARMGNQVGGAR
jgi:hypothetical protein